MRVLLRLFLVAMVPFAYGCGLLRVASQEVGVVLVSPSLVGKGMMPSGSGDEVPGASSNLSRLVASLVRGAEASHWQADGPAVLTSRKGRPPIWTGMPVLDLYGNCILKIPGELLESREPLTFQASVLRDGVRLVGNASVTLKPPYLGASPRIRLQCLFLVPVWQEASVARGASLVAER